MLQQGLLNIDGVDLAKVVYVQMFQFIHPANALIESLVNSLWQSHIPWYPEWTSLAILILSTVPVSIASTRVHKFDARLPAKICTFTSDSYQSN